MRVSRKMTMDLFDSDEECVNDEELIKKIEEHLNEPNGFTNKSNGFMCLEALVKGMYMLLTFSLRFNPFYWVFCALCYVARGLWSICKLPWRLLQWITKTNNQGMNVRNCSQFTPGTSSLGLFGWICYLFIMAGSMLCYSYIFSETESKVVRYYLSHSFPVFVCGAVHSLHKSSTLLLCFSLVVATAFMAHLNPNAHAPADNSVFSAQHMYEWFNRYFHSKHQGMNMQTSFAIINYMLTKCSFQRNSNACSEAFARAEWFRRMFDNASYEFLEGQSYIGEVHVNVPFIDHNNQTTDELMSWSDCKAKLNVSNPNQDYSMCALYFVQHRYQLGLNVQEKLSRWKTTIQPLLNVSRSVGATFFEKNSYARESLTFMANAFMGWVQCPPSLITGLNMVLSGMHMVDSNPVNDLWIKLGDYFTDYFRKFAYEDFTTQAVSRVVIDFPLVHQYTSIPAENLYQPEWKRYVIPYDKGEVVIQHDVAANMPMRSNNRLIRAEKCPSLERVKNISWNLRECKMFELFIMQVIDSSFNSDYPPNDCPKSCKQRYQTTGCLQSTEAVIKSQVESLEREREKMKQVAAAPRLSMGDVENIKAQLTACKNTREALESQSKIDREKFKKLQIDYNDLQEKNEEQQNILEQVQQQKLVDAVAADVAVVQCNSINDAQVKAIESVLEGAAEINRFELTRLIQQVIATPGSVSEILQSFYANTGSALVGTKNSIDRFSDAVKWFGVGIGTLSVSYAIATMWSTQAASATTVASVLAQAAVQAPPAATAAAAAAPVVAAVVT